MKETVFKVCFILPSQYTLDLKVNLSKVVINFAELKIILNYRFNFRSIAFDKK